MKKPSSAAAYTQLLSNVTTAPSSARPPNLTPNGGLLTMYSAATPAEIFDIRCEYEVPRYVDLNSLDEEDPFFIDTGMSGGQQVYWPMSSEEAQTRKHSTTGGVRGGILPPTMEDEFYQWFQLSHDFQVNSRFIKVDRDQYLIK
jgi:hypothetical protein